MSIAFAVRLFSSAERRPDGLQYAAGLFGLAALLWTVPAGAASAPNPITSQLSGNPGTVWVPQGPGPSIFGQVEGIENGEVVGAIHTVAAHPTSPSQIYVGAVNGGVWRTLNATSQNPKWIRLTDHQASNSIGALEFDPTDPSHRTLVAGIGRFSSFGRTGGALTGLLRTTNGGTTWTPLDGGGVLFNKNVSGVAPRGNTIVISVNTATPNTIGNIGIWRTTNGGATFQQVSNGNGTATGLPGGITFDLVGDPNNRSRLFTSVVFADLVGGRNGFFRSDDTGATWTRVSTPAIDALLISGVTNNVEFAVGRHNNVYAAVANSGRLAGLFRSGDGGATWTSLDLPTTNEGAPVGIHPGGQASFHLSIVADPTNANIVYIGGDRQPLFNEGTGGRVSFPNSIGAEDYTGRLFRVDASKPAGSQAAHITHSSALGAPGGGTASVSSPHADSREMTFDALGNLIETDDGGIYKRTNPRSNTGDWFSLIGDLQTTETHNVIYDNNVKAAFGGNQDTGTTFQIPQDTIWETWVGGDGGDVAVDTISTPGISVRFTSAQGLQVFNRSYWDSAYNFLGYDFPALLPIDGSPRVTGQFTTPVVVNGVDGNRIVISGGNGVYESLDQGDTIFRIGNFVGGGSGIDPLAYGAAGNPDAVYVGTGDRVFIRTAPAPAALTQSVTFPGTGTGATVTDIAIDPDDANSAVVSNTIAVFRTTDAGATWTNVTGNLQTLVPSTVRAITFANTPLGDAVVVGTQNGAYFATAASGFTNWKRIGNFLPTVPVFDLDYDRGDDLLIASTMGRGSWKLPAVSMAVLLGGL